MHTSRRQNIRTKRFYCQIEEIEIPNNGTEQEHQVGLHFLNGLNECMTATHGLEDYWG